MLFYNTVNITKLYAYNLYSKVKLGVVFYEILFFTAITTPHLL